MSTPQSDQFCPAQELLDHGNQYKLILIVASSGTGKIRLIQQWVQKWEKTSQSLPIWIFIDSRTNNFSEFLNKLTSEFIKWDPIFEAHVDEFMASVKGQFENDSPDSEVILGVQPQIENFVNQLLNGMMQLTGDRFIIILNYDLIRDQRIHSMIEYLIDYLPPNIHLIISSQDYPPLQIPRLRARRELLEIGSDDI